MDSHLKLTLLSLLVAVSAASCGGGGSDSTTTAPAPPVSGPTDAQRAAAATATATTNPLCSVATLGTYYWEIGNAAGVLVSGSTSDGMTTVSTSMKYYSSSKWLYAAGVLQKHGGVVATDVPFLNFTSGYDTFGNGPVCDPLNPQTVDGCMISRPDTQTAADVGLFYYDSGHMQHHASAIMGMGGDDNAALASDLNTTLGLSGFTYIQPQLASGVVGTPGMYASFLRKMLNNGLILEANLGVDKVCADAAASGCNAVSSPTLSPETGDNELWNYSLGHWVEDDPVVGDHAFSSGGGGGFYPWIDATKTYYGILAREDDFESDAGFHSAQCGRLIRQAYVTAVSVPTASEPTPSLE